MGGILSIFDEPQAVPTYRNNNEPRYNQHIITNQSYTHEYNSNNGNHSYVIQSSYDRPRASQVTSSSRTSSHYVETLQEIDAVRYNTHQYFSVCHCSFCETIRVKWPYNSRLKHFNAQPSNTTIKPVLRSAEINQNNGITSSMSRMTINESRQINPTESFALPKPINLNTTQNITHNVTDVTPKKRLTVAEQLKAKNSLYKQFDIMQVFNSVNQGNIPKHSLTYLINQRCGKAYNQKMEVTPKSLSIRMPVKWQIIDQVENHNPFMFAAFILRKKEYDITHQGQFRTVELYHNTPSANTPTILLNNFDYRKNRKHRRRYGPGICFSNDLFYCYQCTKEVSDEFILIFVDVLIGKRVDRDKYIDENQISIDTGVSLNKKVYVKARDDEFYPKYVCRYRPN